MAMTSARVGLMNPVGVCAVGTWLAATCLGRLALDRSAEDVMVVGSLGIGLVNAIRAHRS